MLLMGHLNISSTAVNIDANDDMLRELLSWLNAQVSCYTTPWMQIKKTRCIATAG